MIKTEQGVPGRQHRIILTANASMTARQMHFFLAIALLFLGMTATGFVMLGAWPVLPFAGLEWLLLAYCMRKTLDRNALREVITLADDVLIWEQGRLEPERSLRLQSAWVALEWGESRNRNHARRLFLRSHGRRTEIGAFLTEDERETLAATLTRLLSDNQKYTR